MKKRGWFPNRFYLICAVLLVSIYGTPAQEAPEILNVQPQNGAREVPLTSPVVFTFTAEMNRAVTRAQFIDILSFPPAIVTMTTAWSADGKQLLYTPVSPYRPLTQIQWFVTGEDLQGRPLSGQTVGTFFTGKIGETTPKLVASDPPNQATDVSHTATVTFTFNVAMNTRTTIARFWELNEDGTPVEVMSSWSGDSKELACSPITSFPPGTIILWRIQGSDAQGNIFPGAAGGFTTVGNPPVTNTPIVAIISRGELARQTDAQLFEVQGGQFLAFAAPGNTHLEVVTPSWKTNLLSLPPRGEGMEFSAVIEDPIAFNSEFRPGQYRLFVTKPEEDVEVPVPLDDSELPSTPRFQQWHNPPYAVAGQTLAVSWTVPAEGKSVDYFRLKISRGGGVDFATPLPGSAGVLTSQSNMVTIPAEALSREGLVEVSLTGFSFIAEGISQFGDRVFAARHRTTSYELRVVNGSNPPPTLAKTHISSLPMDEPLLIPLVTTNGVRPIRYRVLSGELPPGVVLEPAGILTGSATAEGTFNSTVELTDLLGRSVTQTLRLQTVPLPAGSIPPTLENPTVTSEGFKVELVDPTALNTVLEHSVDLTVWTPYYTNATTTRRAVVKLPVSGRATFVRARATPPYPPQPSVNPLTVNPLMSTNAVSGRFNEWGGTLRLTNSNGITFVLTIPTAAINRTETITMTEIREIGGLPLSGGLIAAVDLQPEGLLFDRPVRLDITPLTSVDLKTLVGFNAETVGTRFGLQPSFLTNNTISMCLRHFSIGGAGSGTAADTSAQTQRPPGEGSKRTDQEVADEMARCRMDPNCDINSEQEKAKLRDIFVRQADQVVIPRLREALASDSAVEGAILGWLAWVRQMSWTVYNGDAFDAEGSGPLELRLKLAQNLAGRALLAAIRFNCDLCVRSEVRRIARVITFARWAAILGFDPGNEPFSCMQRCLSFYLQINSIIDSRGKNGRIETRTTAEFDLAPQNLDGSSEILRLQGSGEWKIESTTFPDLPEECSTTTALKTGTAEVKLLRISLYRQETVSTDEGELVKYEFNPQVQLSIKASLDEMPKEGRTITCGDLVNVAVENVFGPTFLAFHNDEVETPEAGSLAGEILGGPVITVTDFFDPGSGDVLMDKLYIREQPLKDGGVVYENTLILINHKP